MTKKGLLTVEELETEFGMSVKSIQRTYRKEKTPYIGLVVLPLLRLDT